MEEDAFKTDIQRHRLRHTLHSLYTTHNYLRNLDAKHGFTSLEFSDEILVKLREVIAYNRSLVEKFCGKDVLDRFDFLEQEAYQNIPAEKTVQIVDKSSNILPMGLFKGVDFKGHFLSAISHYAFLYLIIQLTKITFSINRKGLFADKQKSEKP